MLDSSPLAILSNGSPPMLDSLVRNNGLESYFTAIISVDTVKTYKPSPRVYALGAETLKLPASEILFVSSNLWDACGAKAFGYRVCWCETGREQKWKIWSLLLISWCIGWTTSPGKSEL